MKTVGGSRISGSAADQSGASFGISRDLHIAMTQTDQTDTHTHTLLSHGGTVLDVNILKHTFHHFPVIAVVSFVGKSCWGMR